MLKIIPLLYILCFPFNAIAVKQFKVGIASNFSELNTFTFNPFGGYFKDSVKLALDDNKELMAKAGISISLHELDYGADDLKVSQQVEKANLTNLSAVIGYSYSSSALIAAPLHVKNQIPMLSPSASASRLSTFGKYIHLGSFDNQYMARVLARLTVKELKKKKILIVQAANCAYCMDLSRTFEINAQKLGGTIVKKFSILQGDKEFHKITNDIKKLDFDVVFVPNQELTSARIISAFLAADIDVPFIGADGWGNEGKEFFRVLKGRKFTGYSTSHWHPTLQTSTSQKFVQSYKERFTQVPNDTSALTYDSMTLLIKALAQSKSVAREDIEESLSSIGSFEGVTGRFLVNPNKSPYKDLLILKTSDTGFKVDRVIPVSRAIADD